MSVYKRCGIWYVRIQVGNRRIERSTGKAGTQAQAKELEAALFRRLSDDKQAISTGKNLNRTFGDALLEYFTRAETEQLRSYDSLRSVANLIRPHLESVPLEQVPEAAEKMKQVLLASGKQPATINRRLALVRRILKLAYTWNWLRAPRSVSLLPENNERHQYPAAALVRKLAKACPSTDNGDALLVIFFTGMRRGEFLRVNADPESYIEDGFIKLYAGNKTKKPGRIPIAAEIRPIIARMPLAVTEHTLRANFEAARTAIKRPDLHLHDLRHGFASMLAESGADFLDIMSLLRHASAASTKRYTHLLDKRLRAAVARAEKLTSVAEKRRGRNGGKLRGVS